MNPRKYSSRWYQNGATRWVMIAIALFGAAASSAVVVTRNYLEWQHVKQWVTATEPARADYEQVWRPGVDRKLDLLIKVMCILAADKHIMLPECQEQLHITVLDNSRRKP